MSDQILVLLPLLLPLIGALLVAPLRPQVSAGVVVLVTTLTLAANLALLRTVSSQGLQVYRSGGWDAPYGIVLVADHLSVTLGLVAAGVALACALHTLIARDPMLHKRLYHPLFLLLLAALSGVFYTGDLFNLYVFMELVILSSFPLVALAERSVSAETVFKYAVLSAIGSALLLISIALVYAATGTLNLADIARRTVPDAARPFWSAGAAAMLFAFLLKGGIFPFHFWLPDAHSAAPSPVSALLSAVLVKVGVYGIARTTTLLFADLPLVLVLAPLGLASALFGGLGALANTHLKRLLAYSSIANVGFILLALGWGRQAGLIAALVHTVNHALIKSSLFLATGYLTERLQHQYSLERLSGLLRVSPVGALAFGLGALALGGLPPLNGFVSKMTLFQAGISAQDGLLLVGAVAAGALSITYSLRMFVRLFWGQTPDWAQEQWDAHPGGVPVAPLLLAFACLLLGIWPGPLVELASAAAAELTQPEVYIRAVFPENE